MTVPELREHLARELHDSVAGELQTMLVELELLRRRADVPAEIQDYRAAVRGALTGLRRVVRELRDLPPDAALVNRSVDRKVARALGVPRRRSAG
jgi:signal transduction histidine kinase